MSQLNLFSLPKSDAPPSNLDPDLVANIRLEVQQVQSQASKLWPHLAETPVVNYPLLEFSFIWTWFHIHNDVARFVSNHRRDRVEGCLAPKVEREYKPKSVREKWGRRCSLMLTRKRRDFGLQDKVWKESTKKRRSGFYRSMRQQDYMGTHGLLLRDNFFAAIQSKAVEKYDYFGVCVLDGQLKPTEQESEARLKAYQLEAELRNTQK